MKRAKQREDKLIDYDYIVETLGMPKGGGLLYFEMSATDPLVTNTTDRSVMLRDAVLMWICMEGGCMVEVAEANHNLTRGQMLTVFPGSHCRFTEVSPDFSAKAIVAHIRPKASYNSLSLIFPRIKTLPILTLSEQDLVTMVSLFDYVKASNVKPNHTHRSELDVCTMSLLHNELAEIFLRNNFELRDATPDEEMVKKFNMMLSVSTFEHRDVEHYAKQFSLSPKNFASKIKKVTGESPSEIISAAVINAAKRLLSCTDLSAAEVAKKLYFSSPSFFCRYFARYTGKTPAEWRTSELGNTKNRD